MKKEESGMVKSEVVKSETEKAEMVNLVEKMWDEFYDRRDAGNCERVNQGDREKSERAPDSVG